MNLDKYLRNIDKEQQKLFHRLKQNGYAKIDGRTAQSLSRNKTIKHWRNQGYISFAKDRRRNTSYVIIDPLAELKKKGNKWFF